MKIELEVNNQKVLIELSEARRLLDELQELLGDPMPILPVWREEPVYKDYRMPWLNPITYTWTSQDSVTV